jgi:hypothetical protein
MHYCRWKRHGDPLYRKRAPNGELLRYIEEVVLPYRGADCLRWPFGTIKPREGREYAGTVTIGSEHVLVTRYVCEKVHGPAPTADHEAAHSCGKGHEACVNPGHIIWKTPSANQADRIEHGTHDRGERSFWAKLTEVEARLIQKNPNGETQKVLAARYGTCRSNISMIQSRKRWGWLS